MARGLGAVSKAEFIPDPRFKPICIEGAPASTSTSVYVMRDRRDSGLLRSLLLATGLEQAPDCLAGSA